jgi:F-type H+-transporting ATPase subunit b
MYNGAQPGTSRLLWGKQILMPLGNFLLFMYLLLSKVIPGLKQSLIERHNEIAEGVQEFEQHSGDIAIRYREVKEKLDNAKGEVDDIVSHATSHAAAEKEAIITSAKKQASRIEASADSMAQYEKHRITKELRYKLIERSFTRAEELIKEHINADDQERLRQDQLGLIEKLS